MGIIINTLTMNLPIINISVKIFSLYLFANQLGETRRDLILLSGSIIENSIRPFSSLLHLSREFHFEYIIPIILWPLEKSFQFLYIVEIM